MVLNKLSQFPVDPIGQARKFSYAMMIFGQCLLVPLEINRWV